MLQGLLGGDAAAHPADPARQAQCDAVHQPEMSRSQGKGKSFKDKIISNIPSGAEKVLYLRWCRRCWRNLSQLLQSPFLESINL